MVFGAVPLCVIPNVRLNSRFILTKPLTTSLVCRKYKSFEVFTFSINVLSIDKLNFESNVQSKSVPKYRVVADE